LEDYFILIMMKMDILEKVAEFTTFASIMSDVVKTDRVKAVETTLYL